MSNPTINPTSISEEPVRQLREWAVHHPRVVDGVLAAVVAGVVLPVTLGGAAAPGVLEPGTGVMGLDWLWFVAVHVPLVWRRRAPVIVFWVVAVVVAASVVGGVTGVFLIFPPLVALYAVARHAAARHLWPALGVLVLALALALLRSDPGWPSLIGISAILIAAALLGVALRTRQAAQAERDRHLREEQDQLARIAVADERTRIAREVHDIVAHNLAVMVALADGAVATAADCPDRSTELMGQVSTTGRQALTEMRRLVGVLREHERSPQPGIAELDDLVAQVRAAGLHVTITGCPIDDGAWSPGVGLAVYRIVQEALTNTLKHAGPGANARVVVRSAPAGAEVEIVDDGAGRQAPPTGPGGHGLAGIRERAAAYGGGVEAGPLPGAGWRVHARLVFEGEGR